MASTEKSAIGHTGKRRYTKRERARREEATRRRITEATMELHRTVGPARTTVSDVARLAGVGRMTVYNHFPTDAELIEACSTHWSTLNPLPDPERWREVEDPDERLAVALAELYAWYGETEDMMGKVLRDAPIVPALGALMAERWYALVDRMVDVLADGREARGKARTLMRAALRTALDFGTWQTLTGAGAGGSDAARLAAGLVAAARGPAAAR